MGDLLQFVTLDDVVDFVLVEIAETDAALHAVADFRHVVGEAAKRLEAAVVDGLFAAEDPGPGVAHEFAVGDNTPPARPRWILKTCLTWA